MLQLFTYYKCFADSLNLCKYKLIIIYCNNETLKRQPKKNY